MNVDRSLTGRIARAFVLLAALCAGFFCLVSYIAVEMIESQVVDAQLDRVAESLIGRHLRHEALSVPPETSFFANDAIPPQMRTLAPGLHKLRLGQNGAAILVRVEGGNRYAVVQEIGNFEHAEELIFSALAAGFLSSLVLAILLGQATARHLVAPVSTLAEAVRSNVPPSDLPSLDEQDEIGMLARAFARRTGELQHFLARERFFTGDVSHELRTPLTIMLGAAELLKSQLADRPAQLAVAERLHRVAADTAARVSALLLFSRQPQRTDDAPRIPLNPLVSAELDRCLPLLQGKPVEPRFDAAATVMVHAQPELAAIAIGNLLRNACQHIERGMVRVLLEPGWLIIEDTGPGIPPAVRACLFERFVQGNTNTAEGTGLGLSIVKRMTEHLGWKIRLESPEGGGSRFILTFPPAEAATP